MSGIFKRLAKFLPATRSKGLVGRDLEGNKYFELPNPLGGRMKRTVEYKVTRDLAEYTSGTHRLPVQWTTWLSHTRSHPPTLEELQTDSNRQSRLLPMIAAIEAREQAERIRQGYLPDPADSGSGTASAGSIPAPKTKKANSTSNPDPGSYSGQIPAFGRGTGGATGGGPTFSSDSSDSQPITRRSNTPSPSTSGTTYPTDPAMYPSASASAREVGSTTIPTARSKYPQAPSTKSAVNEYPVPTPPSPSVPPPRDTLDPSLHTSTEDLRRLSEEDTKRRMKEVGVETSTREEERPGGAVSGGAGGLAPRRRGGK